MPTDYEYTFSGKLTEDCKSLVIDFATTVIRILYPIKDDELEITIKKFRRNRTSAQNRYIHGVVVPTVQAWMKENEGTYPAHDALYAHFRTNIIGDEVVMEEIDGNPTFYLSGKRFSQCNTVEFAERVDKIILHYAERGLEIPLPVPGSNNITTDFTKNNL